MWLALALAAALCQVLRNTVMKRLGHSLDEYSNEKQTVREIAPGAVVMLAGVVLLSLAG